MNRSLVRLQSDSRVWRGLQCVADIARYSTILPDLDHGTNQMKRRPCTVNFVCDLRAHDALRETAEADSRSVSSLIRKIIQTWFEEREPVQHHRKRQRQPEVVE
jgi:hypothetical protein